MSLHAPPAEPLVQAIHEGRLQPEMSFNQRAWTICRRIPAGKVATYADLASVMGSRSARAVGQAMARNPYAPAVPCHRVVGSDGRLTGYSSPEGGMAKKRRMLDEEGVRFTGDRVDLAASRVNPATLRCPPQSRC